MKTDAHLYRPTTRPAGPKPALCLTHREYPPTPCRVCGALIKSETHNKIACSPECRKEWVRLRSQRKRHALTALLMLLLVPGFASAEEKPSIWYSVDKKPFVVGPGGYLQPYKWQAPPQSPPFSNWDTYAWYGSWAALAYADWRTTQGALRRGAIESNPLLACEGPAAVLKLPGCEPGGINKPVFIVMNLAPPVGRLIYDAWLYKKSSATQQFWARRLRWLPQAIKGSVALWNTQQTRGKGGGSSTTRQ